MAVESETKNYDETVAEIEETLGLVPGFWSALDQQDVVNEWPNFRRYALEETEIPPKYRELIGLAVAANIRCPYCQLFHTEAAKLRGATDEELAEISFLASWTARYSALIHAQNYDYDTFADEMDSIGAHLQSEMAGD